MIIKFEDIENNNEIVYAELLPEEDGFYRIKTLKGKIIWNLSKKWYKIQEIPEDEQKRIEDEINAEENRS